MRVLHAAVFAYGKAFAGCLQLFFAHVRFFARFKTFGGAFMGRRHGAVTGDVFLEFLVGMRCSMRLASSLCPMCSAIHVPAHAEEVYV